MPINMHPKSAPAFISFGLKTLGVAVASVVLSSAVHAAGMGKLTVLSSLGQPLRAEIELSAATEEEAASCTVLPSGWVCQPDQGEPSY